MSDHFTTFQHLGLPSLHKNDLMHPSQMFSRRKQSKMAVFKDSNGDLSITNDLLFGSENLEDDKNNALLTSTIELI